MFSGDVPLNVNFVHNMNHPLQHQNGPTLQCGFSAIVQLLVFLAVAALLANKDGVHFMFHHFITVVYGTANDIATPMSPVSMSYTLWLCGTLNLTQSIMWLCMCSGAFGPCLALYERMDIKHIQHDSLGYTFSRHLLCGKNPSQKCRLFFNLSHYSLRVLMLVLTIVEAFICC